MEMETCFQNLSKIIWDTSEANLQVSYTMSKVMGIYVKFWHFLQRLLSKYGHVT